MDKVVKLIILPGLSPLASKTSFHKPSQKLAYRGSIVDRCLAKVEVQDNGI